MSPEQTLSAQDVVTFIAIVALVICIMVDYLMPTILVMPGILGNPTHTPPIAAVPEQRTHRGWRFLVRWIVTIVSIALLMGNTPVGQALYFTVNGGVPTLSQRLANAGLPTTVVKLDATMPLPAGFVFDPMTGALTAPADIPAGYQLVGKYDSVTIPLQGQDAVNGTVLGAGKAWNLPKDATSILVRYYDDAKKTVTQFVNPF